MQKRTPLEINFTPEGKTFVTIKKVIALRGFVERIFLVKDPTDGVYIARDRFGLKLATTPWYFTESQIMLLELLGFVLPLEYAQNYYKTGKIL